MAKFLGRPYTMKCELDFMKSPSVERLYAKWHQSRPAPARFVKTSTLLVLTYQRCGR